MLFFPTRLNCLPQAVAFNREDFVRRKYRVMNLLASMFDSADWVVLHSPFIYTAGVTKSVALCDVSPAWHCRRVRVTVLMNVSACI